MPNSDPKQPTTQAANSGGELTAGALLKATREPQVISLEEALQRRKKDPSARLPSLAGARLVDMDLSEMDLTSIDLSGADMSGCNLQDCILLGANLEGAILFEADCSHAELGGANLKNANLVRAVMEGVSLGRANLDHANFNEANLTEANLVLAQAHSASFHLACLKGARLKGASLEKSSFVKADMREANLDDCKVSKTSFVEVSLQGSSLRGLVGYRDADWVGVDTSDVTFNGAHLLRRHMRDQNYLHEFRNQSKGHEAVYWVWWLTSDCGRSLFRWGMFTAVLVMGFAAAYMAVEVDYGSHPTALSPLYFSLVTMTTLGYGDVLPASVPAQVVTMLEVSAGYLMLGGLVSILSSKLARRAD